MRWKVPPVLDAVRRLNRSLTNPRVMRTAGSAGTQTSVIHHVGRTSGRTYETPVDIIADPDGFLIALPYGTRADWVRNVLAAGSATIVSQGEAFDVDQPIIAATAEVAEQIPARTLRTLRFFGVTECLHLRKATVDLVDPANPPSRKAPLVWAIGAAIPWLMLAVAQVVWFVLDSRLAWLHVAAAAVTALGIVVFVVVVPLWRYRVHRWDISPQAVYTRSGWLVQERRIAPISRVQTVDTYRGPLDRLFGLANVTVTTASSAGAVRIVALDSDVADRVVAQLTDIAAIGAEDAT